MWDHVIQMGPMLILAGLVAGVVAETAWWPGGYGLLIDMIVGSVGSLIVGGALWTVLGPGPGGMLAMFLIGTLGGAIAIVAQRSLWRSATI